MDESARQIREENLIIILQCDHLLEACNDIHLKKLQNNNKNETKKMSNMWHKYYVDYLLDVTIEVNMFIYLSTLSSCIFQFVKRCDSLPPIKPAIAPEAPTEKRNCRNKADSKLLPRPDITYNNPIRTAKEQAM